MSLFPLQRLFIDGAYSDATSGETFDTKAALRIANDYIDLLLETRGKTRSRKSA